MARHKWYDTAHWHALRKLVLARDPICKKCNRAASTHADHIKAHDGDRTLFCDMANLQGLCASCHSKKTAEQDGGFGNTPKAKPSGHVANFGGQQGCVSSFSSDVLDRGLEAFLKK